MPQQPAIDRAIDGIVDGEPLDWDALDSQAPDEERELLKCLRILGRHRGPPSLDGRRDAGGARPARRRPAEADASADSAESWGRYRLTEKVGEGSFGSVYRALDPDLQREIAIKILHSRVADAHLKERLLSEGRALAKVRHANVVSVFGVEAHGDRVGLCMEFVHGATLESELLARGTLDRARSDDGRRRSLSRAVGCARRRLRASRRQGQKRHARRGRPRSSSWTSAPDARPRS